MRPAAVSLCYKGERKTIKAWARELGVSYNALYGRYKAGWTAEQILETPMRRYRHLAPPAERRIERRIEQAMAAAQGERRKLTEEEEPWIRLLAAIVNRARLDHRRPAYRDDVEEFFRRGVVMRALDIDGAYILERLTAAGKG